MLLIFVVVLLRLNKWFVLNDESDGEGERVIDLRAGADESGCSVSKSFEWAFLLKRPSILRNWFELDEGSRITKLLLELLILFAVFLAFDFKSLALLRGV